MDDSISNLFGSAAAGKRRNNGRNAVVWPAAAGKRRNNGRNAVVWPATTRKLHNNGRNAVVVELSGEAALPSILLDSVSARRTSKPLNSQVLVLPHGNISGL
ncbi:hypothetical protein [Paenibacillus sp. P46E]|uniref:hypothetical protein n=1 Tax=Paenibacillus sp. P46E TaxID=1349436 RepID=UPI00116107B3|nr:hypothetical protein [Paenibacillus sp. P46E]